MMWSTILHSFLIQWICLDSNLTIYNYGKRRIDVIVLRNINQPRLSNGTRLAVKNLMDNDNEAINWRGCTDPVYTDDLNGFTI